MVVVKGVNAEVKGVDVEVKDVDVKVNGVSVEGTQVNGKGPGARRPRWLINPLTIPVLNTRDV